jgi:Holliday junction resolvase
VSAYRAGRDSEHKVRDDLTDNGYEVIRAAGSKGACDLIAFKPGQVLLVQVKRSGYVAPEAWNRLHALAACLPGVVAVIADAAPRKPLAYWRLDGPKTARGRQPWSPFLLDEVAA